MRESLAKNVQQKNWQTPLRYRLQIKNTENKNIYIRKSLKYLGRL